MDHKAFLSGVPPETRARLTETSDGPALRHLALHGGLIVALMAWIGFGAPLWWLAIWPLGIALAFLFTLQHEATHRTPFRTRWLNEAAGHVAGLLLIQPFLWFRAFHMAHHRFTNLPGQDPELAEPKPATRAALLWHLATPDYWRAKVAVLVANALGRTDPDYVGAKARPQIRREAWAYLGIYAGLLLASLLWLGPLLFWIWLLPLATGFPLLRLYLLAEHGRCPEVANMFLNTRTTFTGRVVRFLAWNMPYHVEHHVWPTVPFHKLPDLHRLTRDHLQVTSPSYSAFTRDYVAGLEG
ncbi:fatty acid desaturase [Rhodobacterales bacterium HKCCE3408]|nr:fatty acid desaturase [Rhodobacterales bacterium HKCCE3408]